MGGVGSGRRSGWGRDTVEACSSIDVNRLHKAGCLAPGWRGSWQWTCDGEKVAWISMRAEEGRLTLSYNYRRHGDEWQDVEEWVTIIWTPCHFGGSRPWFVCPGVVNGVACGRRVAKLYGAGRYFLCRHCYGLAYASQSEGPSDRALRRASNIRMRLGGEPGMLSPFPERPKGMHRRTYEHLLYRARSAERMGEQQPAMQLGRLEAKVGKRPKTRVLGGE